MRIEFRPPSNDVAPNRAPKEENGRDEDGSVNPGSNLFVTGIHPRLTEAEVTRLFEKYGEVEKCQIMKDPHTKESRGFGFVKMVTSEQADAAKEGLQDEEIEGRSLSIEKARRARPRTPTPGKYFGPPKRGQFPTIHTLPSADLRLQNTDVPALTTVVVVEVMAVVTVAVDITVVAMVVVMILTAIVEVMIAPVTTTVATVVTVRTEDMTAIIVMTEAAIAAALVLALVPVERTATTVGMSVVTATRTATVASIVTVDHVKTVGDTLLAVTRRDAAPAMTENVMTVLIVTVNEPATRLPLDTRNLVPETMPANLTLVAPKFQQQESQSLITAASASLEGPNRS